MSGTIFRWDHRISYAQCTVGNHVYHSRYLDILEMARGEFFRHLGQTCLSWQERDIIFPVIECRLRYKGAARYDDLVTAELWMTLAEGIRLTFAGRILDREGRVLVEGETMHVCTSLHDKPRRLPKELIATLEPYLAAT